MIELAEVVDADGDVGHGRKACREFRELGEFSDQFVKFAKFAASSGLLLIAANDAFLLQRWSAEVQ